jgi:hypothetical protein
MSESWIPGFAILDGPSRTGIELRYRAAREIDQAPGWIRVDAFTPDDQVEALAIARVYESTAAFDHPDLPPVLGYGSTTVPGRPFIAFHLLPDVGEHGFDPPTRDEAAEALAEIQLMAYELGLAGVQIPVSELLRLRQGSRMEGRRLPFREFLAEPRRKDSQSGFRDAGPPDEWTPFTAPELVKNTAKRPVSIRQALPYRLASQLFFLEAGEVLREKPSGLGRFSSGRPGGLSQRRCEIALQALLLPPARRPPVEAFLA